MGLTGHYGCWEIEVDYKNGGELGAKEYYTRTFADGTVKEFTVEDYEKNMLPNLPISDKFSKGGLIAPNGRPSNLTPEQWHLVRTPEFKAWFGDWENSPETASKVVDENGEPLVVYHGSRNDFNEFTLFKGHSGSGKINSLGHYFTENKIRAGYYGDKVKGYFLKAINPKFLNNNKEYQMWVKNELGLAKKNWADIWNDVDGKVAKLIQKNKFDGLIIKSPLPALRYTNPKDLYNKITDINYIVYSPTQIKLADGSNTTFDSNNPDIRYEHGGLIAPNGKDSNLTPEQYALVRTKAFKDWFGDWENDPANASSMLDENGEPAVMYHQTSQEAADILLNKEGIFKRGYEKAAAHDYQTPYGFFFKRSSRDIGLSGKEQVPCFLNIRKRLSFISRDGIDYYYFTNIPEYQYLLTKYKDLTAEFNDKVNTMFKNLPKDDREAYGLELDAIGVVIEQWQEITRPMEVELKGYVDAYIKGNGYDSVQILNDAGSFGRSTDATIVFNSNQIKLADGSNTTFDSQNPDIRFELGGIYHGSPYRFDKFSTAHMGTGEGAQAFGWGLYFTELEDIANRYAKIKQNSEAFAQYIYGTGYTADDVEAIERMTNAKLKEKIIEKYEDRVEKINSKHKSNTDFKQHLLDTALKLRNTYLDDVAQLTPTKYRVTLHKGKTPILSERYQVLGNLIVPKKDPNMPFEEFAAKARRKEIKPLMTFKTNDEAKRWLEEEDKKAQYSYLEWDKPITAKQRQAIADRALQEGINIAYERDGKAILNTSNVIDGEQLYNELIKDFVLGSPKEASLFLLRAGIDGIKFPAESIARGATSDTARGFNYVVFDENAVTIEDVEQFAKGGLIAPNGKPSNLTPEQWHLVRTPEFKAWFGDWENSPETASKVVDENGEPLVVYHFSDKEFYVFELKGLSDAFFFTANIEDEEFSEKGWLKSQGLTYEQAIKKGYKLKYPKAKPYFLNIKQFYKRTNVKNSLWSTPAFENAVIEFAKRNKANDGVEFLREIDNKQIIVAFSPTQIKLADGSNTTFEGSNPDIRFGEGGEMGEEELYVIIKGVNQSNKYKGAYAKIFDIIEKDIAFYNPYGTTSEKLIGNEFHITITPKPDIRAIEEISKIKNVQLPSQ
jgi:hypothetical protein